MLHFRKAAVPRTEAGARMEEGEAHAKSKLKSGKRQDRGGKKARGKTEAMRKQGKRKVEAR